MQSPLFKFAFDKSSDESGQHIMETISFPDIDPLVFGLLINWLYTEKIELSEDRPLRLIEAAKLWTVADMCLLPTLQNKALTLIANTFANQKGDEVSSLSDEEVKELCHHAFEKSGNTQLKRLAVDHMTQIVTADTIDTWLSVLPNGMLRDLTRELVKKLDNVPEHTFERKSTVQYFVPEILIKEEDTS